MRLQISNSGLQIFEWELGEAVISAMAELLEGPDSRLKAAVTEKGVLQLLLDARYLMDVLAGGRPAPSGPPSAAPPGAGTVDPALNAALAQRKKAQVEIESMLQVRSRHLGTWATLCMTDPQRAPPPFPLNPPFCHFRD